jgi:hypothetical protein
VLSLITSLCSPALAAEGVFEFGAGYGWGDSVPTVMRTTETEAFTFTPGDHFSARAAGSARINERLELGGSVVFDMPDYTLLYSDRGPSLGQLGGYQVAPFVRVRQGLGQHVSVYGSAYAGATMYSNFTMGLEAESKALDTMRWVPTATGAAGLTLSGFTEYDFFLEASSTWQGAFTSEEEREIFAMASTHAPIQTAQIAEGGVPLKSRGMFGVWIWGR